MSLGSQIRRWWPVILLCLAFATWAAGEYVDDRIDSKLGEVISRLIGIEKQIVKIDQKLEHLEKAK